VFKKMLHRLSAFSIVCVLMLCVVAPSAFALGGQTTIFIIGDSTACNYDQSLAPRMGWGQVFDRFFDSNIAVRLGQKLKKLLG
jgi:lysophospholipase L1-like esterase